MDIERIHAAVAIAKTNADNDNYQCGVSIAEVDGMLSAIDSLHRAVTDVSDVLEIVKGERTQLMKLAKDALSAWDADQESRTGKLLMAMVDSDFRKQYRPDLYA